MARVFLHGTGHGAGSWDGTISHMGGGEGALCPELKDLLKGRAAAYGELYAAFSEYCRGLEVVELCGLSLGGVLALNYALDFPERVGALALIGAPYKVPKALFALQNFIFRLMPESAFEGMAFGKRDSFVLFDSMKSLDFSGRLGEVKCRTLIACGEKDRANMRAARYMAGRIKGAELAVVKNAGHVVNEESPEELARVLDGFFSKIDN